MSDLAWQSSAICRDEDPELFFPIADLRSQAYGEQAAVAKSVCAKCPVRAECLEDALRVDPNKDTWAIIGGTDPADRAKLRNRRSGTEIPRRLLATA